MAKEWEVITKTDFWGRKSYEVREKEDNGCGCGILLLLLLAALIFVFTLPYRLIEPDFKAFESEWYKDYHFWLYCTSAWTGLVTTLVVLKASFGYLTSREQTFDQTFESPLVTLGLFSLSSALFSAYLSKALYENHFIVAAALFYLLIAGFIYLLANKTDADKKMSLFILTSFLVLGSFIFVAVSTVPVYKGVSSNEDFIRTKQMVITAHTSANIRNMPSKHSEILFQAQRGTMIDEVLDSTFNENNSWYKIRIQGMEGWVSGSLIGTLENRGNAN